ncbi:DivIVA domain-containing protein [Corynebacterium incognita]|uniref:DivIVA domain-containing protein n=1 Tax=Corynebacterium incognita TaxID=2754725 RepID=A0A7G7CP01_9CORY|nr:DivIVA domain-containing protein [Corynebacterium incognita]QNE89317.1 DivIVA domain-containing protein [Corynebacterium incognita]
MFSWLLLIVVLVALVAVGTYAWGSIFGSGEVMEEHPDASEVNRVNREHVEAGELDKVAFDVVPRGYRQDQVDALLAELAKKK